MKNLALLAVSFLFSGCATVGHILHSKGGPGILTSAVSQHVQYNGVGEPSKSGESCSKNVLGFVAWGDATVSAAKEASGIREVQGVDEVYFSVLGLFSKYCIHITGR